MSKINNIGIYILDRYGLGSSEKTNSKYTNDDGFIIIARITKSSDISNINNALGNQGIVIDSDGHIWDVTKSASPIVFNKLMYDPTKSTNLGLQPSWQTIWQTMGVKESGIYSDLSLVTKAKYFVSKAKPPAVYGDTGNLGGWLMSANSDGTFSILYNPMNRQELYTEPQPASLYSKYCNVVSLQDPQCYCLSTDLTPSIGTGGSHNYCYYSSLEPTDQSNYNGRTLGDEISEIASSGQDQSLSSNINKLKSGCNCFGVCRENSNNNSNIPLMTQFKEMAGLGSTNTCSSLSDITISACLTEIGTHNTTTLINGNVSVKCDQSAPSSTASTPSSTASTASSTQQSTELRNKMIIAVILLLIIGIIAVIMLKDD